MGVNISILYSLDHAHAFSLKKGIFIEGGSKRLPVLPPSSLFMLMVKTHSPWIPGYALRWLYGLALITSTSKATTPREELTPECALSAELAQAIREKKLPLITDLLSQEATSSQLLGVAYTPSEAYDQVTYDTLLLWALQYICRSFVKEDDRSWEKTHPEDWAVFLLLLKRGEALLESPNNGVLERVWALLEQEMATTYSLEARARAAFARVQSLWGYCPVITRPEDRHYQRYADFVLTAIRSTPRGLEKERRAFLISLLAKLPSAVIDRHGETPLFAVLQKDLYSWVAPCVEACTAQGSLNRVALSTSYPHAPLDYLVREKLLKGWPDLPAYAQEPLREQALESLRLLIRQGADPSCPSPSDPTRPAVAAYLQRSYDEQGQPLGAEQKSARQALLCQIEGAKKKANPSSASLKAIGSLALGGLVVGALLGQGFFQELEEEPEHRPTPLAEEEEPELP